MPDLLGPLPRPDLRMADGQLARGRLLPGWGHPEGWGCSGGALATAQTGRGLRDRHPILEGALLLTSEGEQTGMA